MASNDAMFVSRRTTTLVGSKRKRKTRRKIPLRMKMLAGLRFELPVGKLGKFRINNVFLRQSVCFSKRRQGLFKKASELAALCGTRITVIVFSPAGKPYSCIHRPSNTPSVLDRYISSPQVPGHASQPDSLRDVTRQVSELNVVLAAEKAKEETLKMKIDGMKENIWDADMENLSLEELKVVRSRLLKVMADMAARADGSMVITSDGEEMTARDASGVSVPNMGTSSKEGHVRVIEERNYFAGSVERQEFDGASQLEVGNREMQEDNNGSDEIDLVLKL